MRPSINLLALLVTFAAAAAEPPQPDQTQPTTDQPAAQTSKAPGTGTKNPAAPPPPTTKKPAQDAPANADASPDVFKPSENISEDAAIPYPTDI